MQVDPLPGGYDDVELETENIEQPHPNRLIQTPVLSLGSVDSNAISWQLDWAIANSKQILRDNPTNDDSSEHMWIESSDDEESAAFLEVHEEAESVLGPPQNLQIPTHQSIPYPTPASNPQIADPSSNSVNPLPSIPNPTPASNPQITNPSPTNSNNLNLQSPPPTELSDSQLEKECKRDFQNFTDRALGFWQSLPDDKNAELKDIVATIFQQLGMKKPFVKTAVTLKSRVNLLAHLMLELAVHSPNPSMQRNPTTTVFRNLLQLSMFADDFKKLKEEVKKQSIEDAFNFLGEIKNDICLGKVMQEFPKPPLKKLCAIEIHPQQE